MSAKVYLVGAGPGAADLLTLRAARVLERADIVFHDALVAPQTLAIAERATKIAVGKRSGRNSTAQRFINKQLIDAARRHAVVVRLKGGDPMLFGRAQEEIDALTKAGIEFEVVPGVTAACAASAAVGVSLTRRGMARTACLITPRSAEGEPENDWAAGVVAADTAVIYMGAGLSESICATLLARGQAGGTPVAVVENATLPAQRVLLGKLRDLPRIAQEIGSGPAVIILGEVLRQAVDARIFREKGNPRRCAGRM